MSGGDICGYDDTTTGHPCQHPAGSCPVPSHSDDAVPNGGNPQGRKRESAPSKAQEEQIASVIEGGGSIREACRKAGVHHEQLYRWLEYGHDEPESVWGEFRERLTRARGEREGLYRQALIDIAIENDDTATLMAMLKQREPASWGEVNRGEQTGGVTVELGDAEEYEIDEETLEIIE